MGKGGDNKLPLLVEPQTCRPRQVDEDTNNYVKERSVYGRPHQQNRPHDE
jgi:hypothetical protein